jgi:hypothetical protein
MWIGCEDCFEVYSQEVKFRLIDDNSIWAFAGGVWSEPC